MKLLPGLYVVATPIGNLQDITERAIATLAAADLVAAEDTRHTRKLLQHLGLNKQLVSLHEHNERDKSQLLTEKISAGLAIALVSDAGTPLISDPGYHLVKMIRDHDLLVSPVPGPCALVAALSASGLPSDRFVFEGFLPAKSGARKAHLEMLLRESRTLIFYESPHRILDTLEDVVTVFGGLRQMVMGRELTKTFETFKSGTAAELLAFVREDANQQKGEFVLMIEGEHYKESGLEGQAEVDVDRLLSVMLKEVPAKQACKMVAELTGCAKRDLYDRALVLQGKKV